jgi:hypothetical protein
VVGSTTTVTTTTTVWTMPAFRARAAQDRIDELRPQLDGEVEKRNRAVREAVDGGAPIRQLAPMVGLTRQTIYGILGTVPAA